MCLSRAHNAKFSGPIRSISHWNPDSFHIQDENYKKNMYTQALRIVSGIVVMQFVAMNFGEVQLQDLKYYSLNCHTQYGSQCEEQK